MMEFARPYILFLVLPVAAALWYRLTRHTDPTALRHSHISLLQQSRDPLRVHLSRWLPWVPGIAIVLMVVAAAGPRQSHSRETVEGEGLDIILSLDISGSMKSLDFSPLDRLDTAKDVILHFIKGRPGDRIGLVVFAAKAFTQCPLTLDHRVLASFLDEIHVGLIDDGTAIGLGLATAVARLKHSTSPSRTVILLTDGVNNVPTLEPVTAARLAKSLNIRVYTVAIGREGMVPFPVNDPFLGRRTQQVESHIDLDLLREIADLTGGEMFQATDPKTLVNIFETIDALETARYETVVSTWYRERMVWFALPALLLLMVEVAFGATWLRRLP